MYLKYWGLKVKPFENTPDPKFIYFSKSHEEALVRLFYAVKERKGAMLLTGEYGCGKTVISRAFIGELIDSKNYELAVITNPRYSA